jgi:sortase A
VCYGFGPLFQQRDQRALINEYRAAVYDASVTVAAPGQQLAAPLPIPTGAPVGILDIGAIGLQQVVVEGVAPSQTEHGPGHVPGTAGLGQPGNAVVVGRRTLFGGPFEHLASLKSGDEVLVTTTQGQTIYRVSDVMRVDFDQGTGSTANAGGPDVEPTAAGTPAAAASAQAPVELPVDDLYGATSENQLTLVTSASDVPWNSSRAEVVVAQMVSQPFVPTPQAGRSDAFTGAGGSSSAVAPFVLVLLGYAAIAVGAVVAYRRYSIRAAWLLTTAPLIALAVLLGEVGAQMLPAWL